MEPYKLRIKIGEHEFEAEGSQETVLKQFDDFKAMIQSSDLAPRLTPPPARLKSKGRYEMPALSDVAEQTLTPEQEAALALLRKVINYERKTRLITLTVPPTSDKKHADAVLVLLLGYKRFRGDDLVPVTALNKGLEVSGLKVDRLDRVIDGYERDGLVAKVGQGKGGKYRLTNPGLKRAEEVVQDLLKIVVE